GYRSWYHGDALVVRVDHNPPDVSWIDGAWGLSIEYVDGAIYLTPHESTRVCDCIECAPPAEQPVVQQIIVQPAPVYTSIYDDYYYDYGYYDYDYYARPRSTLFVHSGLAFR